ncbi:metallophosphoesterase family protein (plasmid) [Halorientalis pallida]|uniref:metallophosphoesterase family protein n=1 Tax=Halorientalis pallida TaxID=2479928 RepID=UPI003C6FEB19
MTKILHTADVHLRSNRPERRDALAAVLSLAADEAVDVVTIGGDLFDRPEDVEELRTDLRNDLFRDRSFEVLLIPGNHDVAAYRENILFGDSCIVMLDEPFEHWTSPEGDVRVTGVPYRERPDDKFLLALKDREPFDGTEVLLLHCSLDAPFEDIETGAEETGRYFPVTETLLADLGFDYYLAGHYHGPNVVSVGDDATFTYPGTPASTSESETGRRIVSLLDPTDGIRTIPLDTFHYALKSVTVTPGSEQTIIETLEKWADRHAVDSTDATVTVDGFIAMDETTFDERLSEAVKPATVRNETRNVGQLQSHPLYQSFETELAEMEWDDETRDAVRQRTLEVFSTLDAGGAI